MPNDAVNSGSGDPKDKFRETRLALLYSASASGALFVLVMLALLIRFFVVPGVDIDTLVTGLAVPFAAFATGTLLGLLFAIPQVGSNGAAANDTATSVPRVTQNDSLVRVSQWLTTAIVGASLVELGNLVKVLDQAGRGVTYTLIGCGAGCDIYPPSAAVIGAALLVGFAVGGFLVGYLWTRVIFSSQLADLEKSFDSTAARAMSEGNVQQLADDIKPGAALTPPPGLQMAVTDADGRLDATRIDPNDPNKGQFGGQSEAGGYRLQAEIRKSNKSNFFSIKLLVARTGGDKSAREVEFYLHPTFPRSVIRKNVNAYGNATLAVLAWGAFTVGAKLDNGVMLELDLAEIPDAPAAFRDR